MRIVCISDTHGRHRQVNVPDGDVLIHAGDFMHTGKDQWEIWDFGSWLEDLPHRHKVVVAGNHDIYMQTKPHLKSLLGTVNYLCDSGVVIDGVKFWGSPYQPEFCNWAFNLPRGAALQAHWDLIPSDTDVLITHGPPYGILDKVKPTHESLGCHDLRDAVDRINPKLHVFGHIHGGYGQSSGSCGLRGTLSVNAAVMNEAYWMENDPIVIDL